MARKMPSDVLSDFLQSWARDAGTEHVDTLDAFTDAAVPAVLVALETARNTPAPGDAWSCDYAVDGTDTDGTMWHRCTVHGELAPSNEAPCDGWHAPVYMDPAARLDALTTFISQGPDTLDDGAIVVQIDTNESTGRIRVNLNDGPIWDGFPNEDAQPGRYLAHADEDGDDLPPAPELDALERIRDAIDHTGDYISTARVRAILESIGR